MSLDWTGAELDPAWNPIEEPEEPAEIEVVCCRCSDVETFDADDAPADRDGWTCKACDAAAEAYERHQEAYEDAMERRGEDMRERYLEERGGRR